MLPTLTAFPHPGSLALYEEDGQTVAIRIMSVEGDDGLVAVSVQGRLGASAYKSVAKADLLDPTPLTAAEKKERAELLAYLLRVKRPNPVKLARSNALELRAIRAPTLQHLLAGIPARHFPAAAGARRELAEARS